MALSRFAIALPRAADAFQNAADALRYIRDTQGDLPWQFLESAQTKLAVARVTGADALAEANRQPVGAEAFLASIGGPAALAEFSTLLTTIGTRMNQWNSGVTSLIALLNGPELIALVRRADGATYFERVGFLTAARADVLRGSNQLANLIAAFEAVGA
jgi:hypothetical protein